MKLKELEEMINYCQEKRRFDRCPLMTMMGSKLKRSCLVEKICSEFNDCKIFFWKHIFNMVEDDIQTVISEFNTKEQILKKYKMLADLCQKSRFGGDGQTYCGGKCGKACYFCQKYLHHNVGGMKAVYVEMNRTIPVIEWMFTNIDELKKLKEGCK